MRFIVKAIGTAVAGYAAKRLVEFVLEDSRFAKPVKDVRLTLNKTAEKVGLITPAKRAELNKHTIDHYNEQRDLPNAQPVMEASEAEIAEAKRVTNNARLEAKTA